MTSDRARDPTARAILRQLEADGYALSAMRLDMMGGGVVFYAWQDDGTGIRKPDQEQWQAKGADDLEAATELATMLGYDIEE